MGRVFLPHRAKTLLAPDTDPIEPHRPGDGRLREPRSASRTRTRPVEKSAVPRPHHLQYHHPHPHISQKSWITPRGVGSPLSYDQRTHHTRGYPPLLSFPWVADPSHLGSPTAGPARLATYGGRYRRRTTGAGTAGGRGAGIAVPRTGAGTAGGVRGRGHRTGAGGWDKLSGRGTGREMSQVPT